MNAIISQTTPKGAPLPVAMPPVSAVPALWRQDRIARLTALTPEDARAGLLWLAMNHPDTLRHGLDWRHFRGDGTVIGQIELLDPGHQPIVAWRQAPAFA